MKELINEARRMQQLAGILKEEEQSSAAEFKELIDTIVATAENSPHSEYEATVDMLKQEQIYQDEYIRDFYEYAKGANYHQIADALGDVLTGKVKLNHSEDHN